MTEYFYRYRPIKAALNELENQEIYFSTTDELNDPMEGFKDLFWRGDEIIWRNFLKHCILCVPQTANYCFIAADQFDPNILKNIVFGVPQELPEAPIREIYQRVSAEFLEEPAVKAFLSLMAARTTHVRRSELTSYLRALHGFALQIILKEYRERGSLPPQAPDSAPPPREKLRRDVIAMMEGVTKITSAEYPPERISEALFAANEATVAQVMLINEYNLPDRDKQMPMVFLSSRFPVAYVAALDRLVHRDWYIACFTKTAENHPMWSTYANGHRGVCLMFKTAPNVTGAPTLVIECVTGVSGTKNEAITYISSEVSHELSTVRYTAQYPAINFFRSLGSVSAMHMNNFWYRGDNGAFSECRDAVYADHDAWRKGYWQIFGESALYKTPEWAHEEESNFLKSAICTQNRDSRSFHLIS
jgi:hypothetical protein